MWESPIYKFKVEISGKQKRIFVDVTGSAPNFSKPGKQLEGTFDELLRGLDPSKTKILDFGAAKLRNSIYLLEKGFVVYSCEFNDLFRRSRQAHNFYETAKTFTNFKKLVFPKDFIEFEGEFDVVLLINVLNIMPIHMERLSVLALCREKMKEGGRVLWYTQHGTYSYSDAVARLRDGIVTGKGRKFHMFYRDFSRKEIHQMLAGMGFSFDKSFKFPTSGSNQAYVFIADGPILVDKTLGITELLKRGVRHETIERKVRWINEEAMTSKKVIYETRMPTRVSRTKDISILGMYSKELDKTSTGRKNALKYHKLIFNILKILFENKLKNPKMEEPLADKTKWVDITFKNPRVQGFFGDLAEGYNITCPNIFIECKNYKNDITNPEFAQIHTDLNKRRGQFGILICRHIKKWDNIKRKQILMLKDEKFVIVLEDSDIKKFIDWKLGQNEEKIDEYLEEKFKELI